MEEEVTRMKTFLQEFNNDQIQSPTSDETAHTRIGNYPLDPEDVTGQVIDWVLNYLDNRNCPHSLALSIAKEAALQVNISFTASSLHEDLEKYSNSTTLYAEAISKLPAICNSFLNQANLEPICTSKYATSVFAIKNKRRKMEDRHVIYHDLNALLDLKDVPHQSYYAVFDGHSGIDAACYASAQLHLNIAKHPDFLSNTPKAIIDGYQITDLNFLNKCNKWNIKSGSTAVSALIRGNIIYLSWLGDSQAVLVKEGVPVTVTEPHKPDREDEKQRIESLGGHVSHLGTWRVNGLLAVTRAIGDPDQKQYISSEPELAVLNLDGTEDFLIIACDGLWDGMSPEDATGVLYRYLVDSSPDEPLDAVAAKLVHQSKLQGSEDNITAIVIFLRDIKDIKENSAKFMSSSYCAQGHDFISMNGSMKTLDIEHSGDTSFSKPTVLELNAASSKKLKNAANVMSSAGFGSASYSYQYVENAAEGSFQNIDSSAVDTAQNVFCSQNVTASCFAPEATALSELPTPPIDDMLASQQFENFYSTDLYKEFSNSMQSPQKLQTVETHTIVDINPVSNEPFQSPADSPSTLPQPIDDIIVDVSSMSLLDTENNASSNPEANISPDEAVGIACSVVSNAIETAVKCLSSSETQDSAPVQSPKKLNPYAKPFVMKSFFNSEDSDSKSSSFVSKEIDDASLTSVEEQDTKLDTHVVTDCASELSVHSDINQLVLGSTASEQFSGDKISQCIAGNTAAEFVTGQGINLLAFASVSSKHCELENISDKFSAENNLSITESNLSEQFNQNTKDDSHQTDGNASCILNKELFDTEGKVNVLNSDTAQEHLTYQESEISAKENVEVSNKELGQKGNNLCDVSDLQTENIILNSNIVDENIISHDMIDVISTSDKSKNANFSPLPSQPETTVSQTETPEQESVTIQSLINLNQSDMPENDQNFDLGHTSMSLTSTSISVVSESESKFETMEKCIGDTLEKDNPSETAHLLESSIIQPISLINMPSELISTEIEVKTKQEPEIGLNTQSVINSVESVLPSSNQNSNLGDIVSGLTSEKFASSNLDGESEYIPIVNTVEMIASETSQLTKNLPNDPISLIDIKNELIPAEAEVPSVEDSHAETVAVDLKSLPVGIPEAEGVTEDIDSDSEKDGGWSYMKGNIVSGSKAKPDEKASKALKSSEVKSGIVSKGRRDTSKSNLDMKSKVKNTPVDKTKSTLTDKTRNISVDKIKVTIADKSKSLAPIDKTKTVVADKSKNVSSVDKTKTLTSVDKTRKAGIEKKPEIKGKIMKSSTLSTSSKVSIDKTSRVTGVSSIKKETTDTSKTTSTVAKSNRSTTLVRASAPASKPTSMTVTDRSAVSAKVITKPKVSSTLSESKLVVKNVTSTLSKGHTTAQIKSSSASTRTAPVLHATTVPSKTSTISKSVQKSTPSESKPKQPISTASTLRRPITTTIKKSDVKEVKDNVNKQILAKKSTTASKVESNSTLLSRKVTMTSSKSTITKTSSSLAKSNISKKEVPKSPGLKSAIKNVGSKVSQDSCEVKEERVESAQSKTEETQNNLNIESDQKNITKIMNVTEEKFILETSDKEITKDKGEISNEGKNVEEGSLTNPVTPVEDKTPAAECTPGSL